jgi:hypothetical protein
MERNGTGTVEILSPVAARDTTAGCTEKDLA